MRKINYTLIVIWFVLCAYSVYAVSWGNASQATFLVGSNTAVVVASFTNRQSITLTATGPFIYRIGSTTVDPYCAPVLSVGFELLASVPVAVKSVLSTMTMTVVQDAY